MGTYAPIIDARQRLAGNGRVCGSAGPLRTKVLKVAVQTDSAPYG